MINNYKVVENSEVGIIETFYEEWESTLIKKSFCECYLPKKDCIDKAYCRFEDSNGNVIANLALPNDIMYSLYNNQSGVVLVNDDMVILCGWNKYETSCYSLKTNELLWTSKISKVCDIFVYANKVYAYCSTSKDELYLLSLETGKVLKKLLYHKSDLESLYIYRLSGRYLVGYNMGFIFIYDMKNDELSMSRMFVKQPSKYYWLHKVISMNDKEVLFRYKELDTRKGETRYQEQIINIETLIKQSIKCKFDKTVPTEYSELESEYNRLFSN